MGEVAGIVIGDGGSGGEARGVFEKVAKAVFEEEFGEVEGLVSDVLETLADDLAVLFEGRSAPGGVDNDGVVFDDLATEVLGVGFGFLEVAGVGMEGSAAGFMEGDGFVADSAEEAFGSPVDIGKEGLHDAPFEEIDLAFYFGEGGWFKGWELGEFVRGRDFCFGRLMGDGLAEGVRDFVVRGKLAEGELDRAKRGVGGEVEKGFAGFGLFGFGGVEFLAGEFEDFSVLNGRGTGGFAGSAAEAGIEGLVGGFGEGLGFFGGAGEGDASAGGLAFVGGEDEGGAGFEAEAAADALGGQVGEVCHGWRVPGGLC